MVSIFTRTDVTVVVSTITECILVARKGLVFWKNNDDRKAGERE